MVKTKMKIQKDSWPSWFKDADSKCLVRQVLHDMQMYGSANDFLEVENLYRLIPTDKPTGENFSLLLKSIEVTLYSFYDSEEYIAHDGTLQVALKEIKSW